MKRALSIFFSLLWITSFACAPASADDEVEITADVLSTAGAPEIMAKAVVPFGKRSDDAAIKIEITGLEPKREVFFKVSPMLDAFERSVTDANGMLVEKIRLPYGLEPGVHDVIVESSFSAEDIPASYTIGQIYVSDFGILMKSATPAPTGTEAAEVILENSNEVFKTAPVFPSPKGSLRTSYPQLRVSQGWLPILATGLTFNNDTAAPVSFKALITLETFYGSKIGNTFFVDIKSLKNR